MQKKKKWTTPKLIVLVRGKHNERILLACKVFGTIGDPSTDNTYCLMPNGCVGCFSTTGS
ncbi:MAG TPA: hypothetical protein VI976_02060 [Candidatus Omnitrophota bacterium]|nr:hypothetical protein [Candidatus Omnitrophota bacterium]